MKVSRKVQTVFCILALFWMKRWSVIAGRRLVEV